MYEAAESTDCRNWDRRKNLFIINSTMEINLAVMNKSLVLSQIVAISMSRKGNCGDSEVVGLSLIVYPEA